MKNKLQHGGVSVKNKLQHGGVSVKNKLQHGGVSATWRCDMRTSYNMAV